MGEQFLVQPTGAQPERIKSAEVAEAFPSNEPDIALTFGLGAHFGDQRPGIARTLTPFVGSLSS